MEFRNRHPNNDAYIELDVDPWVPSKPNIWHGHIKWHGAGNMSFHVAARFVKIKKNHMEYVYAVKIDHN